MTRADERTSGPASDAARMPTPALARALVRAGAVMPRREMEELLRRGTGVVAEVAAVLRESGRTRGAGDPLWAVVVLGELRDEAAIPALERLLGRPGEVGIAAADALGKIGAPAVPSLRRAVERGSRTRRLHAYGALATIRCDDAYRCLQQALRRDRALGAVIARAVAQHGRREAMDGVWQASRRAPSGQRAEFEAAIAGLAHGPVAPDPTQADWRVRYRRLPRLDWRVPPSWLAVAERQSRTKRPPAARPARSIRRTVADPALRPGGPPCHVCGGLAWRPSGVTVCQHTGRATLGLQRAVLARWIARGVTDVWTALDASDAAEARRAGPPLPPLVRDCLAMTRATVYWLVSIECYDLRMGVYHLETIARHFPRDTVERCAHSESTRCGANENPVARERHGVRRKRRTRFDSRSPDLFLNRITRKSI